MKKTLRICLISIVILVGAFLFIPKPPLLNGISYSQAVFANNTLLRITLSQDKQYRIYTPLNQISKQLVQATLRQEDRYFYYHFGVNPVALVKGFWTTYVLHHRRQGASTITMQVARMRYHLNTKTILGKLKQMYYAVLLERYYSKQQILQAYLNLAPYGGNIEGVGAASLVYYHKQPSDLTLAQALTLVVIPQNPTKRMPRHNKTNKTLRIARARLLATWQQKHNLTATQKVSFKLPIQVYARQQLPFLAPHFADYVLQRDHKAYWLNTTLNLTWQNLVQRLTSQFIQQWSNRGIHNAAVLLIDTNTMGIKAMLGSADFFNVSILGQVNGTNAKRSPGSTLKPFIYALALQQGLITPKSIVYDLPTQFKQYVPENMDAEFLGPIPADEALVVSRNIPALVLDNQLGDNDIYNFLVQAGIKRLKSRKFYGLSLVLGGGEVTMLELAKLYAMLPNSGFEKPLRYEIRQPETKGKPLLSPEASFITLDMLTENPSLNTINSGAWVRPKIKVAWKTGTSSGNRDAWSVAVFSHYILVVWVGDFRAKSNPYVIGRKVAAPLLFKIIAGITDNNPKLNNIKQPANLNIKKIAVCESTGMLPNKYCPKVIKAWFIPGVSPIKQDNIYRQVAINKISGLRSCTTDANTESKVFEFWPSQVQEYFIKAGIRKNLPPPYEPTCNQAAMVIGAEPLHITSPQNNNVYYLTPSTQKIPLIATAGVTAQKLYWFIDGAFIGTAKPGQALYWQAKSGMHQVAVLDIFGKMQVNTIVVK